MAVFQGLQGQLDDRVIIAWYPGLSYSTVIPKDLRADLEEMARPGPRPAHTDPLFLEEPFQVTDQGNVVADQEDPFHLGVIFSEETAAVDEHQGLPASRRTFNELVTGLKR